MPAQKSAAARELHDPLSDCSLEPTASTSSRSEALSVGHCPYAESTARPDRMQDLTFKN